jgi:hypothetical protein
MSVHFEGNGRVILEELGGSPIATLPVLKKVILLPEIDDE